MAIGDERKKSGRCDLTVAKEKFMPMLGSALCYQEIAHTRNYWDFSKKNEYLFHDYPTNETSFTFYNSYRLARMDAAGLLYKWQSDGIQRDAAPCLRKID